MTRILSCLILCAGIFFIFAGGPAGCGAGAVGATLNASISLPPDLSAVGDGARLSLKNIQTGQIFLNDSGMIWNEAQLLWQAGVSGLEAADYEAILDWYDADSPAAVLARAVKVFSLPKGVSSVSLSFQPSDFSTSIDSDGDGLTNLQEFSRSLNPFSTDTDGDGVLDNVDQFPSLSSETLDEDNDGLGNRADNCIAVANPAQTDTDGDRLGDVCDTDNDNDGVTDADEILARTDPLRADSDGDGVSDGADRCPLTADADQHNTDGDGMGNACDPDDDNDGVTDLSDNCPLAANFSQIDTDRDGRGDACVDDADGDAVRDLFDNCPLAANADQTDTDGDLLGDACDSDDDNDGLTDEEENASGADHLITQVLVSDSDGDGIADGQDRCPLTVDPAPLDTDQDGEGDACDCDPQDASIQIRKALFVSMDGDDAKTGAQNDPVRTIARAVVLAAQNGGSVYVMNGIYEEAVVLPPGISLLGGFAAGTCRRNRKIETSVIRSGAPATVTVSSVTVPAQIDGLILQNQAASGTALLIQNETLSALDSLSVQNNRIFAAPSSDQQTRAVVIQKTSPVFLNNVIVGGGARFTVGIELIDVPAARIINNTIHGGRAFQSATAIKLRNAAALIANNLLITENRGDTSLDDQRLIFHDGKGLPAGMILKNNLLAGNRRSEEPKLFLDSAGTVVTTPAALNALGDTAGNRILIQDLAELVADIDADDYHLILGSEAVDAGEDPAGFLSSQTVKQDHEGQVRPRGATHDIGAYEY